MDRRKALKVLVGGSAVSFVSATPIFNTFAIMRLFFRNGSDLGWGSSVRSSLLKRFQTFVRSLLLKSKSLLLNSRHTESAFQLKPTQAVMQLMADNLPSQ